MDRRLFLLTGAAWTASALSVPPQGGWKQGTHYIEAHSPLLARGEPKQLALIEVFTYACQYCFRFDPYIRDWRRRAPASLTFLRIPVAWTDKERAYAALYYTMQALGREDLHETVFDAIQVKKQVLYSKDDNQTLGIQAAFAQEHGVRQRDYADAYHSAAVAEHAKSDSQLLSTLGITITPTNIVNRKFITDPNMSTPEAPPLEEQFARFLELTDYLLNLRTA